MSKIRTPSNWPAIQHFKYRPESIAPYDERAELEIMYPYFTLCLTQSWPVFNKDMMFGFLHGADMMILAYQYHISLKEHYIFVEDELRFLKMLCRFRD